MELTASVVVAVVLEAEHSDDLDDLDVAAVRVCREAEEERQRPADNKHRRNTTDRKNLCHIGH